jgi:hypothetical protein
VHIYVGGTFNGVTYASYDDAYNASDVLTTQTFYDANGNVVGSETYNGNVDTATVGGQVLDVVTTNPDGSYDVHFYTGGTYYGVTYASYDDAYNASKVLTTQTFYDANGNVVGQTVYTGNGSNTVTVGGVLLEQTTVNGDGSYVVQIFVGGTFNGVPYASYSNSYTAANVLTSQTFYDGSGNVVGMYTVASDGADGGTGSDATAQTDTAVYLTLDDPAVAAPQFRFSTAGSEGHQDTAAAARADAAPAAAVAGNALILGADYVAAPDATDNAVSDASPRTVQKTTIGPEPTRDTLVRALLLGGIAVPASALANGAPVRERTRNRRAASLATFDLLADRFESDEAAGLPDFDLPSAMHSSEAVVDWEVLN